MGWGERKDTNAMQDNRGERDAFRERRLSDMNIDAEVRWIDADRVQVTMSRTAFDSLTCRRYFHHGNTPDGRI